MSFPELKRQNAKYDLWAAIYPPLELKVVNRRCDACDKLKSSEFYYRQEKSIKTVYACSLTCFNELQKGNK